MDRWDSIFIHGYERRRSPNTYPGTSGNGVDPHSPEIWWRSEWQIPQNFTLSLTSLSPGCLLTFTHAEGFDISVNVQYFKTFHLWPDQQFTIRPCFKDEFLELHVHASSTYKQVPTAGCSWLGWLPTPQLMSLIVTWRKTWPAIWSILTLYVYKTDRYVHRLAAHPYYLVIKLYPRPDMNFRWNVSWFLNFSSQNHFSITFPGSPMDLRSGTPNWQMDSVSWELSNWLRPGLTFQNEKQTSIIVHEINASNYRSKYYTVWKMRPGLAPGTYSRARSSGGGYLRLKVNGER